MAREWAHRAHQTLTDLVRWSFRTANACVEAILSLIFLGTLTAAANGVPDTAIAARQSKEAREQHAARMRRRRPPPDANGKRKALRLKRAGRDNRISTLEALRAARAISKPELAELLGLLAGGDTYDAAGFPPQHRAFKAAHNAVLVALTQYCQRAAHKGSDAPAPAGPNCFVLDGRGGLSSRALRDDAGVDAARIYVANRHADTIQCLRKAGLPVANTAHASAQDALARDGPWGDVAFTAIYLDACGLSPKPILDMVEAVLDRDRLPPCIALGFTLLGGVRDAPEREQEVVRAVVRMANRKRASPAEPLRVSRVGDDPERYGVDPMTAKGDDGTLTTWLCLEPDRR